MKILVCIKQVPDLESKFEINGNFIQETDLVFKMNEYDTFAVEEAVQTKEANPDSELVVLSLGPTRTTETIKKALAMGADKAIHIVDEAAGEKDPYQIASLLHAAVKEQGFDLIFTGQQSQDLGSSQVGVLLGELLGINSVTTIVEFSTDGQKAQIKRELDGGLISNIEATLPLLVTCQLGLNTPRYPTLPNIMKAKKKEIQSLEVASLSPPAALLETVGLYPPEKGKAVVLEGDLDSQVDQLMGLLKGKASTLS